MYSLSIVFIKLYLTSHTYKRVKHFQPFSPHLSVPQKLGAMIKIVGRFPGNPINGSTECTEFNSLHGFYKSKIISAEICDSSLDIIVILQKLNFN